MRRADGRPQVDTPAWSAEAHLALASTGAGTPRISPTFRVDA
jgi:hypothetical protein